MCDRHTKPPRHRLFWRTEQQPSLRRKAPKHLQEGVTVKAPLVATSTGKTETVGHRVTLKELCPEDKQRVRQLIEDLARVGTEKEVVEEKLKYERRQFQEHLTRMKRQQRSLAREKEELASDLNVSQLELQSHHTHTHPTHVQEPLDGPSYLEQSGNVRSYGIPSHIPDEHSWMNRHTPTSVARHPHPANRSKWHRAGTSGQATFEKRVVSTGLTFPGHATAVPAPPYLSQPTHISQREDFAGKHSSRCAEEKEHDRFLHKSSQSTSDATATSKEPAVAAPSAIAYSQAQYHTHLLTSSAAAPDPKASSCDKNSEQNFSAQMPLCPHEHGSNRGNRESRLPSYNPAARTTVSTGNESTQRDSVVPSATSTHRATTLSSTTPQPKVLAHDSPLVEEWTSLPLATPEPTSKPTRSFDSTGTVTSSTRTHACGWNPLPPSHFTVPALNSPFGQNRNGKVQKEMGTQTVMLSSTGTQTTDSPLPSQMMSVENQSVTEAALHLSHPSPLSQGAKSTEGVSMEAQDLPTLPNIRSSSGVEIGKTDNHSKPEGTYSHLLPHPARFQPEARFGAIIEEDSVEAIMATALHTAQNTVQAIRTLSRTMDTSTTALNEKSRLQVTTDPRLSPPDGSHDPPDGSHDLAATLNPGSLSMSQLRDTGPQTTSTPTKSSSPAWKQPGRSYVPGRGSTMVQSSGLLSAKLHVVRNVDVADLDPEGLDDSQLIQDLFFLY